MRFFDRTTFVAAAIFVVTFIAALWWFRPPPEGDANTTAFRLTRAAVPTGSNAGALVAVAPVAEAGNLSSPAQSVSGARGAAAVASAPAPAAPEPPAAEQNPESTPDKAGIPVPVVFAFRHDPDTGGQQASLQNQSGDELNVSVRTVNPATGSQSSVQVQIPRARRSNLIAAGLMVEPGDEMTIVSPPYRAKVFTVQ